MVARPNGVGDCVRLHAGFFLTRRKSGLLRRLRRSTSFGVRLISVSVSAIETIPPFLMAGTRFFSAGSTIRHCSLAGRSKIDMGGVADGVDRRRRVCFSAATAVQPVSESLHRPWFLAAVMVATVPIYIVLLGWLTGRAPRPKPIVWPGLAGGFLGVSTILLRSPAPLRFSSSGGSHPAIGMSILLFSSFIWSAGSLYSRMAKNAASPFFAAAQQMLCGGLLLIAGRPCRRRVPPLSPDAMSVLSLGAFAYLVLIGAIVGFTAYIWLLRHCDPAKVATYAYVNPIKAALLGAAFAGETLSARTWIAAGLTTWLGSVGHYRATVEIENRAPDYRGNCSGGLCEMKIRTDEAEPRRDGQAREGWRVGRRVNQVAR